MTQQQQTWTEPPRVLAIDDEYVVCESIRRVLSGEGYEVETTTSPLEGVELLRKGNYDLLLLDIKMPEIDGIQVLQIARDVAPETEVLIITGYATIDTAVGAIKTGAFDYLEKPVSPPQLLVAVARALEHKHLVGLTQRLRAELETRYRIGNVICSSAAMRHVMELVSRVAPSNSTVLITGETGTGKDIIARAIHYNSARKDGPFVVADCASLSESLLESELFGHIRGSFTGAVKDRKGLAQTARGGTLFLDEISTISPQVQASLLRLMQEREIRPVGSDQTVPVDVRLVAATNKDLQELVDAGSFREDLFYRLEVFAIRLPPLRERREEIPLLAHHFVELFAKEFGKPIDSISPRAMSVLESHDWPGNVRELEHAIERAVLLTDGPTLNLDVVPTGTDHPNGAWSDVPADAATLAERKRELRAGAVDRIERLFVLKALRNAGGNVSKAAKAVGMARPNLHALMRKHGITGSRGGNGVENESDGVPDDDV